MTYRDGDDAEQEREGALEQELRGLDRVLGEEAILEARRRALGQALRGAEDAIGARRAKVPLPLLSRVQIASPCSARWDEMMGDARVRHCASCDKDVYDLSEMTAADAEALLSREGPIACVRLHRRADGTVITADCPVGAKKKRRRRMLAAGVAVASSVMAAAASLVTHTTQGEPCVVPPGEHVMMGAIAAMPPPTTAPSNVSPAGSHPMIGGPMIAPSSPIIPRMR